MNLHKLAVQNLFRKIHPLSTQNRKDIETKNLSRDNSPISSTDNNTNNNKSSSPSGGPSESPPVAPPSPRSKSSPKSTTSSQRSSPSSSPRHSRNESKDDSSIIVGGTPRPKTFFSSLSLLDDKRPRSSSCPESSKPSPSKSSPSGRQSPFFRRLRRAGSDAAKRSLVLCADSRNPEQRAKWPSGGWIFPCVNCHQPTARKLPVTLDDSRKVYDTTEAFICVECELEHGPIIKRGDPITYKSLKARGLRKVK